MNIEIEHAAETLPRLGASCLDSEVWEDDPLIIDPPQLHSAPSIRNVSGEWVGNHEPQPTLYFPWCNE